MKSNKSNLLIKEPPLQVLPSLALAIGLNEAIVLQQLHYWIENPKSEGRVDKEGNKWVYNTYEQWRENFPFWSVSTIQRIFSSLEEKGVVISDQLDKHDRDMRKFYQINYEQLDILHHVKLTSSNVSTCDDVNKNTETTPETTTLGASAPPNLGLEWQLTHGQAVTQHDLDVQKEADYRNSADTIAVEFGVNRNVAYDIALAFQLARQMVIPQGKVKGQRKAVREMIESRVTGEHVKEAVKKLIEEGMTITDLFSVVRTAIDIANPKPEVERLRVSKAGGHAESRNPLGI